MTYMEEQASDYYDSLSFDTGYTLKLLTSNAAGEVSHVQQATGRQATSNFAVLPEDLVSLAEQYELVAGTALTELTANQVVLFLPDEGTLTASQLKLLGYADEEEVKASDIVGKEWSVLNNDQYYQEINQHFLPNEATTELYQTGDKLTIAAVVRAKDSNNNAFSGLLGYSADFLDQLLAEESQTSLVKQQAKSPTKSLLDVAGDSLTESCQRKISVLSARFPRFRCLCQPSLRLYHLRTASRPWTVLPASRRL